MPNARKFVSLKAGFELGAVEHLVEDKSGLLQKLFDRCDLPRNAIQMGRVPHEFLLRNGVLWPGVRLTVVTGPTRCGASWMIEIEIEGTHWVAADKGLEFYCEGDILSLSQRGGSV